MVPILLLLALGGKELLARPDLGGMGHVAHALEEFIVAMQQPRFHQVGRDGDIVFTLAHAILEGAHAVADLETHVPQETQQRFQEPA